jgi:hypothetical protein
MEADVMQGLMRNNIYVCKLCVDLLPRSLPVKAMQGRLAMKNAVLTQGPPTLIQRHLVDKTPARHVQKIVFRRAHDGE